MILRTFVLDYYSWIYNYPNIIQNEKIINRFDADADSFGRGTDTGDTD